MPAAAVLARTMLAREVLARAGPRSTAERMEIPPEGVEPPPQRRRPPESYGPPPAGVQSPACHPPLVSGDKTVTRGSRWGDVSRAAVRPCAPAGREAQRDPHP